MNDQEFQALKEPFPVKQVKWRIGQYGMSKSGKPYAMVLAYIDSRDVMNRLDDVLGCNWQNTCRETSSGFISDVLIKFGDDDWRVRSGMSEKTNIAADMGAESRAFVRAAVKWGVSRYLYYLKTNFAEIKLEKTPGWEYQKANHDPKKKTPQFWWKAPALPYWAVPEGEK